jgi:hypothetical protein
MSFRASVRAATMTLLDAYKAAHPTALRQTYPGRPLSISPPCAFPESISEELAYTPAGTQRTPLVAVRLVKGTFDSEDTVDEADAFVDGFIDYVVDNRHAAGANTLFLVESVEDDPLWTPEWIADSRPYYSTLISLRGEGLFGGVT